jgi:hypothetical protein
VSDQPFLSDWYFQEKEKPWRSSMEPTKFNPSSQSAQSKERDQAVEMARRVLQLDGCECSEGDVKILARQLLRALSLS